MVTTRTFPEDNLIKSTDLKYPITIDVANKFEANLNKLIEMLGITRKISVNEGMTLRTYAGYDVTLGDGAVPEGEVIPLSKVARKTHSEKTISLKKYRKATTAEDIQMFGTNEAVTNTDNALIRELQKKVRTDFVTSLKTGTGTSFGTESYATTPVYFSIVSFKEACKFVKPNFFNMPYLFFVNSANISLK